MRLILGIDTTSNRPHDLLTNVPLSPRSLSPGRRPRTSGHHYETVSDSQSRVSLNNNNINSNIDKNVSQPPIVKLLTQPAHTLISYPTTSNELIQHVSNAVSRPVLSSTAQLIYNSSYSGIQVSFSLFTFNYSLYIYIYLELL
jgi:hypothetical protein